MYTFPELLKQLREASGLTQKELAKALDVSTVLIAMIETEQKQVSKGFILKLADRLEVQPSSLMPFVFVDEDPPLQKLSRPEKALFNLGQELQTYLIKQKSKKLKEYA